MHFQLCLLRRDFAFLSKRLTKDYLLKRGPEVVENVLAGVETLTIWATNNWLVHVKIMIAYS